MLMNMKELLKVAKKGKLCRAGFQHFELCDVFRRHARRRKGKLPGHH